MEKLPGEPKLDEEITMVEMLVRGEPVLEDSGWVFVGWLVANGLLRLPVDGLVMVTLAEK